MCIYLIKSAKKTLFVLTAFGLLYSLNSIAQNVSDFANYGVKYKEKSIVYLNLKTEIKVDIEKTGLKILETKYEDAYYNNFIANAFAEKEIESSHFIKMKDIEASTLIPDNDKFKEIKVKDFKTKEVFDESIFYQDLLSTSFIYPSLRQGAITKLKYSLDITDPRFLPYEVLKRSSPIENFEFVINTDKDVVFEFKYFNTDTIKMDFTKVEKGGRIIYTWKIKNISSYKDEDRAPNFLYFTPQIVPYIKSYKNKSGEVSIANDLNDLFKWYNENVANIDHKHTDEMIATVAEVTKDCKSDIEKVGAIYKWVQSNIKYVANEYGLGGFVPRNPYQIYEKRYGDCKDMATIIVELLDIAKIKAYYTWVGTRDLPYLYSEIPTSLVDNHMIATFIDNGNYLFLDATNNYNQLGLPSGFIQGKEALVRWSNDKFEIKQVPIMPADSSAHIDTINIHIENGKVIGKGKLKLTGYYYADMQQVLDGIKDEKDKTNFFKSYLEKGNNKFQLDSYKPSSTSNSTFVNYDFNIADYLNSNNDELYLNLNFSQPFGDFELFKPDRKVDYEFHYNSLLISTCILSIPDSYELKYLPKNSKFENEDFIYTISYEKKDNQIVYVLTMRFKKLLLKPAKFEAWNKMIKQLRADYKESIVLKKKK